AKLPADRFATASVFAAELTSGLTNVGTRTHALTKVRGPFARRRTFPLLGIFIGLLIAAVVSVPYWHRSSFRALDPDLIAVAPFASVTPSLKLLGENLVDYLSRSLDGAGP